MWVGERAAWKAKVPALGSLLIGRQTLGLSLISGVIYVLIFQIRD